MGAFLVPNVCTVNEVRQRNKFGMGCRVSKVMEKEKQIVDWVQRDLTKDVYP